MKNRKLVKGLLKKGFSEFPITGVYPCPVEQGDVVRVFRKYTQLCGEQVWALILKQGGKVVLRGHFA